MVKTEQDEEADLWELVLIECIIGMEFHLGNIIIKVELLLYIVLMKDRLFFFNIVFKWEQ